ncbi:hypothetical protein EV127DRAFT_183201 [Xylaria flabelliformis]|nr:hypothetical protein EV127DRAFT_183201 [Xylaria flabelliformis]
MPQNRHRNRSSQFESHSHGSGLVLNYFSGGFHNDGSSQPRPALPHRRDHCETDNADDSDGGAPIGTGRGKGPRKQTPQARNRRPRANKSRNRGGKLNKQQHANDRFDKAETLLPQHHGPRHQAHTPASKNGLVAGYDDALEDIEGLMRARTRSGNNNSNFSIHELIEVFVVVVRLILDGTFSTAHADAWNDMLHNPLGAGSTRFSQKEKAVVRKLVI